MNTRIAFSLGAVLAAGAWQLPAQPISHLMQGPLPMQTSAGNMVFFSSEMGGPGEAVKDAPYSAQTTTEFTQVLADGNRIYRKQTGMVYRDSEGRTRREQTIGPIGPLPGPAAKQVIFLNDPVAGVSYVLDPDKKTAQKMPLPKVAPAGGVSGGVPGGIVTANTGGTMIRHMEIRQEGGGKTGPGQVFLYQKSDESAGGAPQNTNLGARTFDAVQADGTRSVMTIAAGQVGNEKPIELVDERWFSPQLQTTVLSKHIDPRMGDTVYQLTNISTAEPAHSLFEVPADYQVTEGKGGVRIQMEHK